MNPPKGDKDEATIPSSIISDAPTSSVQNCHVHILSTDSDDGPANSFPPLTDSDTALLKADLLQSSGRFSNSGTTT